MPDNKVAVLKNVKYFGFFSKIYVKAIAISFVCAIIIIILALLAKEFANATETATSKSFRRFNSSFSTGKEIVFLYKQHSVFGSFGSRRMSGVVGCCRPLLRDVFDVLPFFIS